ncbi:MAG TPA: GNAT family N-acetyltransferase [Candidatus Ventrousia excrementavium]|uniref:GNAT family N-acetyltransferase n=1 Tax=Candidatus Ventrousia excrementavium TaxID=2840961 RepID=A0A9D1IUW3_9CLOT|nr:GNAT family N-acetyltransferase [Candidatus Ventrousia excrementavium]
MFETARLLLLRPDEVTAAAAADYVTRNREFLAPYEPQRPENYYTPCGQSDLLRRQSEDWHEKRACRLYLSPKERPELIIGYINLSNIVMGAFCSCFMGYQLDRDYINRGLMTEAVQRVVRFAFDELGLHRIEGNIMPRNRASIRVVEKCGFYNEGLARKYLRINGVWEDHIHFVRRNESME